MGELFFARLKYWMWFLLKWCVLGVIYVAVIAEGLRQLMPPLGQRLHKVVPFLADLKNYEGTYKLDLAPFLSLFILIGVFDLWERLIVVYLRDSKPDSTYPWHPSKFMTFVLHLGLVLIGADAILFYLAMSQAGWGSSFISFSALIAVVAYGAVLVFVSFMSARLSYAVKILKNKETAHAKASSTSAISADSGGHVASRLRTEKAAVGNGTCHS